MAERACALALFALALALRLALQGRSVWDDEAFTYFMCRGDLEHLNACVCHDYNPWLYYLQVKLALSALGERGLRAVSLMWGLLLPILGYAWLRARVAPGRALVGLALLAVSPVLVYYSQEARVYAFLFLGLPTALILFARLVERPGLANLALSAGASVVCIFSHYLSLVLIPTQLLWCALRPRRAYPAVLSPLCALALFLCELPIFRYQNTVFNVTQGNWEKPGLRALLRSLLMLGPGPDYASAGLHYLACALFGLSLILLARSLWPLDGVVPELFAIFCLGTWGGFWLLRVLLNTPVRDAYFSVLVVPVIALACLCRRKTLAPCVMLVSMAIGAAELCLSRTTPDFAGAARGIQGSALFRAGDPIVFSREIGDWACFARHFQAPFQPVLLDGATNLESLWIGQPYALLASVRRDRLWVVGKADSPAARFERIRSQLEALGYRPRSVPFSSPGVRVELFQR